ncbi:MAG: DUF308 domain-containing protein, partial [Methanomassiliicoccaceae archaeon]|nr:DUF308 domain-containing protein [Methanomassiliicoccaceae archaeon]
AVAVAAVQIIPGGTDNSVAATYSWEGTGKAGDPYQIGSVQDLANLADDVNGGNDHLGDYFILTKDIDLNVAPYKDTGWTPIGNGLSIFSGSFNGNGYTISNMFYNNTSNDNIGLFGFVSNGFIENLGVVNANVAGGSCVGGVVGYSNGGTVENCYVTGTVVEGSSYVGGVAGYNDGIVENCYSSIAVTGNNNVGGVVGLNPGTVENCYNTGAVALTNSGGFYVGGVVGQNTNTVDNCYNIGPVASDGSYFGGVVGYSGGGTVENCFFRSESSGINDGLFGIGNTSVNIGAMPTPGSDLKAQSTYPAYSTITGEGWDFGTGGATPVWFIIEGKTYPMLFWQIADSGSGADGDPYIVTTMQQLENIEFVFMEHYVGSYSGPTMYWQLGKDIDATGYFAEGGPGYNGGSGWEPIGEPANPFYSSFDGNGHTITGMMIDTGGQLGGMFCNTSESVIKNLGLVNIVINGNDTLGGLVCDNGADAIIDNCYVIGTINGELEVGGVAGTNYGTVENCHAAGTINCIMVGGSSIGGVVGLNFGTVVNCYSACTINGSNGVGGVVGSNGGMVEECYNTGAVTGSGIYGVGGVVGTNDHGTLNCYNTGAVTFTGSGYYVGGIVGRNDSLLENCYNTGSVTIDGSGTLIGGVAGANISDYYGLIKNCFFLSIDGINDTLSGYYDTDQNAYLNDNAEPIGDAEMRKQSTFPYDTTTEEGWDFGSTGPWGIYLNNNDPGGPGYGYPFLKTIENFILITPDVGSMAYDGKPAPDPMWTADKTVDKGLFTGALLYDPSPAVDINTYKITIGELYDLSLFSPFYQISFVDGVQFEITKASVSGVSYSITASSDANSTITPPGKVSVQSGSSYTFTYSAASGYHISSVIVNGNPIDQDLITGSYTFTDVLYNQTIDVYSASGSGSSGKGTSITLTVDIVGGNGTAEYHIGSEQYVSFTGAQIIPVGSNLYVSVIADSGYSFVEWTGDVSSKNAEVNFTNVSSDIHLVAHLSNGNAAGSSGNLAILNLILAVFALLLGIIAIIAVIWRSKKENKTSGASVITGLLALILGIVSIIVFFLTEDLSAPITSSDSWTAWMAILFIVAAILAEVSFHYGRVHKTKGKD